MAETKAETPVANTDGEKQGEEQVKTGPKVYKAEEVKQHNSAEDCWVIINGKCSACSNAEESALNFTSDDSSW